MDEFEAFVATHYERVRRALTVVLRDPRRAEDVTQEAFAQAMRHWSRVAAMERPEAWVYVVAVNRARRDLRHEVRPAAMIRPVLGQDVAGAVAISLAIEPFSRARH